jgi:hypothetical protein
MAAEIAREGRVAARATAGSGLIPDLREFVIVEACTDLESAALSFGVRTIASNRDATWFESDRGQPDFRITRTGCFRGAVPVSSRGQRIDWLRFRARSLPHKPDRPPPPRGRVRLTRINAVFTLNDDWTPGPSIFTRPRLDETLELDGRPLEFPFMRGRDF